ncbi:DNA polymerase theta [Ostrinia nubilalis]|uniref:DNA polymerase theta n=1 Tax=Ostrinia nubilalis TaxID=29057 RepID=UPI003082347B
MAKIEDEVLDSQLLTENIGVLQNCFDNSFSFTHHSIITVKEYLADDQDVNSSKGLNVTSKKNNTSTLSTTQGLDTTRNNANSINSQILESKEISKKLKDWGLPKEITQKYELKGIREMFEWQVSCLGNPKVLMECCNLVYSAPTSAGKTLVAELITIKTILERQKKVIIILPFVSIVREKMFYLQDILSSSGIRVEGFMGSQSPPGGLQAVHIAICTIEKANSLVNRLLDDGSISELGAVIVDELHLLGDPQRGYILELLLTKVRYVSTKFDDTHIQIVGMSATLPNLEVLANWLDAELFITQFRPIPLDEYCLVGNKYYNKSGELVSSQALTLASTDSDYVLKICLDTISEGCSVLIFCMTKNRCENLAQSIASSFYKLGSSGNEMGLILRNQLKSENILEVLEQLKNCPVSLDHVLKSTISFGVAYHHAGLTFDERDIIEGGFKSGAIRILVATSTLSSGVNLPARKVIIRTPVFQRQPINILTYKQMIGRAGRMGKDTKGESILVCTEAEKKVGFGLMMGALEPVKSCIESEDKFMRAVLEMIASQVVCTKDELDLYSKCTLLFTQQEEVKSQNSLLDNTLKELQNFELVRTQKEEDEIRYVATPLGKACLSSSMAPNDGLSLFCELQKARQCLVLETDLHLVYLVTPYSVSYQWGEIDWLHLLTLWESLTKAMKRVGELVGVQESFIIRCLRGGKKLDNSQNKLNIHKRFYTALALQDLVNEVPLSEVAAKFQCARGLLQSLQQAAATFAGMVTAFCRQLGWKNMEMLISQFQDRLHFGIHSELLELMKLPSLNGIRARSLFDSGFETISSIASADSNKIENALHKAVPFQSEKERDGDDSEDIRKRNKMKNIWITGCCAMTAKQAAENLIKEARKYLEYELGVSDIKWDKNNSEDKKEIEESQIARKENSEEQNTSQSHCNLNVDRNIEVTKQVVEDNKTPKSDDRNNVNNEPISEKADEKIEIKNNSNNPIKINRTAVKSHIKAEDSINITEKPIINNNLNSISADETIDIKNKNNSNNSMTIDGIVVNSHTKADDSTIIKEEPITKFPENAMNSMKRNKSDTNDIVWDSLNFTEAMVGTSKFTNNIFSPNISFGDVEDKPHIEFKSPMSSKMTSVKDISLFSSDGDNSSLFEDSLPLDMIPSKLLDNEEVDGQVSAPKKQATDYTNLNSNTILQAFKTTIIEIEDDEDIKLVYDDERKTSNEFDVGFNATADIEVIDTQEIKEVSVKKQYISPFKRVANTKNELQPKAKKIKKEVNQLLSVNTDFKSNSNLPHPVIKRAKSKKIMTSFEKQTFNVFILREGDISDNLHIFDKLHTASIYLDVQSPISGTNEIIGSKFFKQSKALESCKDETSKDKTSIKSITVCYGSDVCVLLDLTSISGTLLSVKQQIGRTLKRNNMNWKVLSLQSIFVPIKRYFGVELPASSIDISLLEWLIDSDEKPRSIFYLAKKYCDIDIPSIPIRVNNIEKKYKNLESNVDLCLRTWFIWNIAEKQNGFILKQYQNVLDAIGTETQIAKILSNCEFFGLTVDKALASQLLIDVRNSQETLHKKAFKICGYHFNFNSSKDVAKVLGIYKGRKVSTKKSVLTSHNSPMSSIIIYWRKLNSILTKTLYPLTEKACIYSEGDRINPSYTMYTCTGRVSMHEPNLQNVPRTFFIPMQYLSDDDVTDDVVEFNCRNIFKAAPGYVLVSADYCQLEMRILTHYSEDPVLTKIMSSDVDVFKSIAASWSSVPEEEVDDDLRQKAKQLCYGILYGMGNKTLSTHLDVSEMEAAVFMDTFYKTYPSIKQFTLAVIEECKKKGYVETLMKRRRYLPDINSSIPSKRSSAERQAVNTTIQGSAADIAKAAMCAIDTRTDKDLRKPRHILQMHDELIYEVPETNKQIFISIIKEVMENTVQLKVPLPVKVKAGYTWGSLQEMQV